MIKSTDIYLEGKKIYLRSMQPQDFGEPMIKWVNDREVTRYLYRGTFPANAQTLQDEFQNMKGSMSDLQFAICLKENSQYIGVAGLHGINWIARNGEFRILIGEKSAWGKGAGTEVLQLLTSYAMDVLNFNKVYLGVNEANVKAHKSYLKAGFKEEGRSRQEIFRNGKYFDAIRMSLLKGEYLEARSSWPIWEIIQKQLSV